LVRHLVLYLQKQRTDGVGYLGWEYGASQLLRRMPLGKYSGICIVLWGMVLSCFAAVDDFGGAVAIRLFLGVCEASVTPGFALLTSQVCPHICCTMYEYQC
jgi:hypothetical protein